MKKTILLFAFSLAPLLILAQAPGADQLQEFNKSRNTKTANGLKILGGWALANIATSSYLYYNTKGTDEYFHQMNVMWNGVNTVIVAASLLPKQKNNLNLNKTLQWQSNTETTYMTSAALDLLYASAGLYMTEKAKNDFKNHDKWKGWGNSLVYNGGFLFGFDTAMYILHKRNGKKLYNLMEKVDFGTSGLGLHVTVHI